VTKGTAPTEGRVAKPERQWGCHRSLYAIQPGNTSTAAEAVSSRLLDQLQQTSEANESMNTG